MESSHRCELQMVVAVEAEMMSGGRKLVLLVEATHLHGR
jgi:hypothetical protein